MKRSKSVRLFFTSLILLVAHIPIASPIELAEQWDYSMISEFDHGIDLFEKFNATSGFRFRQSIYLNNSRFSEGLYAQASRVYAGDDINEETIEESLDSIYNYEDSMDFRINGLLRMLYLNLDTDILSIKIKNKVCDALGKGKYWYTEPSDDTAIFFTENHQILFHTSELLVGQLFPNDTFTNSGMTGNQHVENALPLIERWLDWRGQLGFTEWNSNTYLTEDIAALVNLVDFASDADIVYKAAMILDLIAFGFANNYYKNRYATSMGRCYDNTRVITSRDSISEAAWIMLGLGKHNPCDNSNMAAVALATSENYAPPPILEEIAENASLYFEHKERNSIYLEEGPDYGIKYKGDDLMYWWSMAGPLAPQTIEGSFNLIEKYDIDPWTICGPQFLIDFLKISSFFHGMTLSEYSETLKLLSRGACYETANVYTYRTPNYQLSGAQDHMKGMNGFQEHIWQASLDDSAYVFTNSPGGLSKDFKQFFMGGWKPRATFYKNIGVIQYDRESLPLEGEFIIFLLNAFTNNKPLNHAYFPKLAFDDVKSQNGWTFGAKDDGYIALYSYEPTRWASDYELRVKGFKNVWIVELGSSDEYDSFDDFVSEILDADVNIIPEALGYDVYYNSPSQGKITVSWNAPFYVDKKKIDLGDYPRFDNNYCYQKFGTKITDIRFESKRLELNFNNCTRYYKD